MEKEKFTIFHHSMSRLEKDEDEYKYSWMDVETSNVFDFYIMESNKKAMEFFKHLHSESNALEFVLDTVDTMPNILSTCEKYRRLVDIIYKYVTSHKGSYINYKRPVVFIRLSNVRGLTDNLDKPYTKKFVGDFDLSRGNTYKLLPYFFKRSGLARIDNDIRVKELDEIHAPTALWVLDAVEKFNDEKLNSRILSEFKRIQELNTQNYILSKI